MSKRNAPHRKCLRMQTRSEILAAALAALCIASPTVEARLKELEPGRGRQAAPQQVQGATSVFAISDAVSDKQKQVIKTSWSAMPVTWWYCKHVTLYSTSWHICMHTTYCTGRHHCEQQPGDYCITCRSLLGHRMLFCAIQTHVEFWSIVETRQSWLGELWDQHLLTKILHKPALSACQK